MISAHVHYEQEFKQLKQQLDSQDRRIKRHEKILEERKRQDRQCAWVLYGLKEPDVQPPQDWKSKDASLTQLLVYSLVSLVSLPKANVKANWISNKRLGSFPSNNRKPRPVLIEFSSREDKHQFLQLSKPLRQSGLRLDDWLTEQQQRRGMLSTLISTP
ncbi:TPA: hypothetical protein ACH3X2_010744 [Trebouxia sp. C0005]